MTEGNEAKSSAIRSVTPHLVVSDGPAAIAFYQRAFGAEERFRMPAPDGERILHAELQIGGAPVMLASEFPEFGSKGPSTLGGTPVAIHLNVDDVDAAYDRAVQAGAAATMPPADMFWGDRYGRLTDPFGHVWSLATHIRDVTPEEMAEGAKRAFSGPD
ncbi:MAG: VOC family protein [Rhodospirillales bacterium]|nr:VOC family protein [Rhodospirillales bacterium]